MGYRQGWPRYHVPVGYVRGDCMRDFDGANELLHPAMPAARGRYRGPSTFYTVESLFPCQPVPTRYGVSAGTWGRSMSSTPLQTACAVCRPAAAATAHGPFRIDNHSKVGLALSTAHRRSCPSHPWLTCVSLQQTVRHWLSRVVMPSPSPTAPPPSLSAAMTTETAQHLIAVQSTAVEVL